MELDLTEILLMMLSLGGNASPWITGGFAIILALWKWVVPKVKALFRKFFVFEVELEASKLKALVGNDVYRRLPEKKLRSIIADIVWTDDMGEISYNHAKQEIPVVQFLPGEGKHKFTWNGHKFALFREEVTKSVRESFSNSGKSTDLTLRYVGTSSKPLKDFCQFLVSKDHRSKEHTIDIIAVDSYGDEWGTTISSTKRSLDTVYLEKTVHDELLNDIGEFKESRQWYADVGIPYRRGYMFYGPPGCGKSSLAKAIASEFDMNLYTLSLSSKKMDDTTLINLLRSAKNNSIILLEDIDGAFHERKKEDDNESRITFSGLLNAIDGVASREGNILITTTNHIDRLDPALVRPGRIDRKFELRFANQDQMYNMFLKFFPEHENEAKTFSGLISENIHSLAAIQNFLIHNKKSISDVLKVTDELLA